MLDHQSKIADRQHRAQIPVDLVSELLLGMRLNGLKYSRLQLAPPFGVRFEAVSGRAQFHFIASGTMFLRGAGGDARMLGPGDAVLLPHGGLHDLVSAPDLASRDLSTYESTAVCDSVSAISACPEESCRSKIAMVFSGCMEFDLGGMQPLIALMPEVMLVGTLLKRQPEIVPMLQAMEREVHMQRAGSAGILARLADVVSASIVRGWAECGCGDAAGWLDALRDPRLSGAIGALHRNPGHDWTVAELAREAGTSRSAFAERFLAVTGVTPLRYVTDLRMRLAAEWIGRDRMPIEAAAERLGYGSHAAFSRAFKRVTGRSPGTVKAVGAVEGI